MMTMKSNKTMKTILAALTAIAVVTVYSLPISAYATEKMEGEPSTEVSTTQSEENSRTPQSGQQASGSEEKEEAGSKEEKSEAGQKEEEKTQETPETQESSETPETPAQASPQMMNLQLQPEEVQETPSYEFKIKYTGKGYVEISPYKAKEGETVTVKTNPSEGWECGNIKGTYADGTPITFESSSDLRTHTFTMGAQAVSVRVTFKEIPVMHTITVNVVSGGGVAYANVSQAAVSESVKVAWAADAGYRFKDVSGNVAFVTGYKFSMPNEDVIVNVYFEEIPATTPPAITTPPAVTPPAVNPPEGGHTGGTTDRGNRTPAPAAEIPEIIEDEETPLGDADMTVEEEMIEEEAVPLTELPKTGGMGSLGFMGLGAILASLGIGLKRKEDK